MWPKDLWLLHKVLMKSWIVPRTDTAVLRNGREWCPTCPCLKSIVALDTCDKLIKVLMNNIFPPSSAGWGAHKWLYITSRLYKFKQ